MTVSRRSFLKAQAATVAALGLSASGLMGIKELLAAEGAPQVVWLQAQGCSGCSVSLLNSVYYTTVADLLVNTLDMEYNTTIMAAAGATALAAADGARQAGGYILAIEGAIPTGAAGAFCQQWPGISAAEAVSSLALDASFVLAVGTCAAYGGVAAAAPNPTHAVPVSQVVGSGVSLINIPGCPPNPDWIVGTIAHLLEFGSAPRLDRHLRPLDYFADKVHEHCPYEDDDDREANQLGQGGCLYDLGCRGKQTRGDCAQRRWHSPAQGQYGSSWCIEGGSPCHGCTEPGFPDAMAPFFFLSGEAHQEGGDDDDDDDFTTLAGGGGGGGCFVVTAVCGDVFHPTVLSLRSWRERTLRGRWWGDILIRTYNWIGPHLARVIERSPWLRTVCAPVLGRLARLVEPTSARDG